MNDKLSKFIDEAGNADVKNLYNLIEKNPQFLKSIDEIQFVDTPLHIAARNRETTPLAIEILNLMPSFGKKLNHHGLSPLHVAIDCDMTDTARTLVKIDGELVRVKGKNGLTPLHCLLLRMNHPNNGNVEEHLKLVASFLYENPNSINDVNNKFQTAIHLALENNDGKNNKAFELLLGWIVRRGRNDVLGLRDDDGNTPLHVAVKNNNIEAVKRLVLLVKRNKKNKQGKTPLDIADELSWSPEMKRFLIKWAAQRSSKLAQTESIVQYLSSKPTALECVFRSFVNTVNDISLEMQSVLLVVAALITTATYTAVLQPPGGVYQVSAPEDVSMMDIAPPPPDLRGKTVIGVLRAHPLFMRINTVAFGLSIVMFTFVLHGKNYYVILHASLICLAISYLLAMEFTSLSPSFTKSMCVIMWTMIGSAYAIKWLLYLCAILLAPNVVWAPSFASVNVQDIFYYGPLSSNMVTRVMGTLRRQYRIMAVKKD